MRRQGLLLLALVMTQETPAKPGGPDGWPERLLAEPFPEIALARMPPDLRDALRALWLVIGGSAQFFASRARSRGEAGRLAAELAALGRDLETLSTLAKQSAGRNDSEPAGLRAMAFEVADQLGEMARDVLAKLEGQP